jgi:DNA polymerase III alpha subunit
MFPDAAWIAVELLLSGDDAVWLERLRALSRRTQMPLVAAGDVHMHCRRWNRCSGSIAKTAGLVTNQQRPGTASGVIFVTLEDETGFANLIVWPKIAKAQRIPLLTSTLMMVSGIVQKENDVLHLIVGKIENCSHWLQDLQVKSRDFQ